MIFSFLPIDFCPLSFLFPEFNLLFLALSNDKPLKREG
jgi:hypothetical protein